MLYIQGVVALTVVLSEETEDHIAVSIRSSFSSQARISSYNGS